MQVRTVGELSMFLSFLHPNTELHLDEFFPTLIKRPGGSLSIERWSDDEVVQGHLCNDHCG
jgi:hypothetical protein